MKKFLTFLMCFALSLLSVFTIAGCNQPDDKTLYVYTNAGFPPYEYLNADGKVVGVDIDIMNKIGEELGYKVVINDIEFEQILNEVAGNKYAIGAAGMTKRPDRDEVAVSSITYSTSVQYVIVPTGTFDAADLVDGKLSIAKLAEITNSGIGVQAGTTGQYLVEDSIAEGGDLYGANKSVFEYKDAILASQDIGSGVGAVVIDKLPAQMISSNNEGLECFELDAEPEAYVLYLNKDAGELLTQINNVLTKLINDGTIDQYILNHSGAAA